MVGSSKILTVSYGTFSCTLEGFDDSFDTMKAIAEYFRDLAADDRYFGAEPPTPDAEMLARIAEREIARRVEAHEERGRIVLKAQDARSLAGLAVPQPPSPEAPRAEAGDPEALRPEGIESEEIESQEEAPRPAPSAQDVTPAENDTEVPADERAEADWAMDWQEVAEQPAPAEAQSLAAKLDLIRSVVGGAEQYSEDEHAQDFVEAEAQEDRLWDAPEDLAETDDTPPATEAADEPAEAVAETSADETWAAEEPPQVEAGETMTAPGDIDEAWEDEPIAEEAVNAVAETPEHAPLFEETAVAPDAVAEMAQPGPMPGGAEKDSAPVTASFEDTLAALMADATPEPVQAAHLSGQMTVGEDVAPEPEAAVPDEDEGIPVPDAPAAARVLKVKRADFEAAQAEGLIEDAAEQDRAEEHATTEDDWDDETDDSVGNIFGEDDSALSPEEEADLQRELAELEAELREDEPTEKAPAPVASANSAPARPEQTKLGDVGDENDLARIFEEADSQMAAPENSKRRNTIQHLRAALAATRAEKEAGADLTAKVDESPYRGDLAAAVRPRRPEAAGIRSARPEEPRPAPLKLVAEQRVDVERVPVRPRRVASPQPEVLAPQESGFSEFAQEMGATVLPDLLEAAAAYLADVEGRVQFSRPMLMGKLREVDEEGFSREDGLRSFGQLLREGKLQKLSGGRFAVTEETEFRAAAKRRAS